uniref:Uncharacterized protein n=1 Tax=Glossina palpalis gambiensis TaxID=67801 RepID=A0A1B0AU66_9MUSC
MSTSSRIKSNYHSDKDSVLYKDITPNDPSTEKDSSSAPFSSASWNEIELGFIPIQTKCFA